MEALVTEGRSPGSAGVPDSERDGAPAGERMSWGPLLVLLGGTFMTILDFFIVNVAVPSMQDGLGASRPAVQMVVAGYGFTFAVGLITGGRLGDLHGSRRVFTIGLVVFSVASAACAASPSADALIAARLAQGVGAALLTPQVLAMLSRLYTGRQRAAAFAVYGTVLGLSGVFGQLIGGALIQADVWGLGWRVIFLINVPIAVLLLAATRRVVPAVRPDGGARLDLPGTFLLSGAVAAFVLPVAEGREYGWPLWTWLSLVASALLFTGFLMQQRRSVAAGRDPLVHPALFGQRGFGPGLAVTLVFLMASGSLFFILALYLQQGRGMSALASGVLFVAVGVGFFAGLLRSAALAARFGGRNALTAGTVLATVGYLTLAVTAREAGVAGSVEWLVPGLVVVGLGLGLVLAPLSGVVLEGVAPRYAGAAAGVLSTAQELGGVLGVTLVGAVFYSALGNADGAGFGHAFAAGSGACAVLALVACLVVRLLPRPAPTA